MRGPARQQVEVGAQEAEEVEAVGGGGQREVHAAEEEVAEGLGEVVAAHRADGAHGARLAVAQGAHLLQHALQRAHRARRLALAALDASSGGGDTSVVLRGVGAVAGGCACVCAFKRECVRACMRACVC